MDTSDSNGTGAADRVPAEASRGVSLSTGGVDMSGYTTVVCTVIQQKDVQLRISARADCTTENPLSVSIQTKDFDHSEPMDVVLKQHQKAEFSTFAFPPPASGALVRTRVSAKCVGSRERQVWGTARCSMP